MNTITRSLITATMIGGAALGLAGVASATTNTAPQGPGYSYSPGTYATPAPTVAPAGTTTTAPPTSPTSTAPDRTTQEPTRPSPTNPRGRAWCTSSAPRVCVQIAMSA